jgi:hypothetical protein
MNSNFNRRDFLKLASLSPLGWVAPKVMKALNAQPRQDAPKNVLIVIFDAFSAQHFSTYGYQRQTTPHLAKLAEERAVVYHNHFAGSNFTTSGTASILTGTLPWINRALQSGGEVIPEFADKNIFSAFENYYRISYTHNGWANTLLEQFRRHIDELIPWKALFVRSNDEFIQALFDNDSDIASVAWTREAAVAEQGYAYSLFFSHINEMMVRNRVRNLKKLFPRGIPSTGFVNSNFILETAVDWVGTRLPVIPKPFMGYFHFLPPHGPYNTSLDFFNIFGKDDYKPVNKPEDIFTIRVPYDAALKRRAEYDEFLLYVDKNFKQLFDMLEQSGILDDTWLVITSDHGEMFERGISGHSTNAMYQPVVRVPLLIFEPGRKTAAHIHTPTSAVDLLPTLLHVTGQKAADWTEGLILPPYAEPAPGRSLYSMRSTKTEPNDPMSQVSAILVKEKYKLHYYFGYKDRDVDEMIQLYDIEADPEELNDLAVSRKDVADALLAEMKAKLVEVDKPYIK